MIKLFRSQKEYTDSGFGTNTENQPERLVNKDGTLNVHRRGLGFFEHLSFFHELIRMRWWKFNLLVIVSYLVINLFFGSVFWLIGMDGIGLNPGQDGMDDFLNAFYFSAQTFSTVGFGRINPVNHAANLVAVIEMLIGMMYLALAAGLLYGRFSRPVSRIIFSKNALVSPYRGGKGLMVRISNAKNNLLIDVEVQWLLSMMMEENGKRVRRFYQLNLERNQINMLALTWTIVHPIDESSPIYEFSPDDLEAVGAELLMIVKGMNDTFSQIIHARTSHKAGEVIWDAKFTPIYRGRNGKTIVDIDRIGQYSRVTAGLNP
jgi:inward rectifier potassium channel